MTGVSRSSHAINAQVFRSLHTFLGPRLEASSEGFLEALCVPLRALTRARSQKIRARVGRFWGGGFWIDIGAILNGFFFERFSYINDFVVWHLTCVIVELLFTHHIAHLATHKTCLYCLRLITGHVL